MPATCGSIRAARRAWRADREVDADRPPVRCARVPRPPRRPGRVQTRDPRRRLAVRLRGRPQHRRGLHPSTPCRDRRTVRSALHRDRPRCRVPARRGRRLSIVRRTIRFPDHRASPSTLSAVLVDGDLAADGRCPSGQLTDNLDEGLARRADTIAAVLADSVPPELAGDEDLVVQVVAAGRRDRRLVDEPRRRRSRSPHSGSRLPKDRRRCRDEPRVPRPDPCRRLRRAVPPCSSSGSTSMT